MNPLNGGLVSVFSQALTSKMDIGQSGTETDLGKLTKDQSKRASKHMVTNQSTLQDSGLTQIST